MSPQREAAIRYLAAQIAEYRADLAIWRGATKAGGGLIQRMVISPLQGLIEDRMQQLSKLRGKPDLSNDRDSLKRGRSAPAERRGSWSA